MTDTPRCRVVQVTMGRFNQFDLARQMQRHGMLERLIVGYPRWKMRGEGLPDEAISCFPYVTLVRSAAVRAGLARAWLKRELTWRAQQAIDRYAARILPDCDVVVAQSGQGLAVGRAARARGIKHVCHRGSCHIRTQRDLMVDEYRKWGLPSFELDARTLAKEEREYHEADLITVPSEFARQTFLDQGLSPEKVRKTPYGVDLRRFAKSGDPDPEAFDVLFVGQLCLRKGVPYLLQAFRQLRHRRKRLRLVGRVTPEVKSMVNRERAHGDIELYGHLPLGKIPQLMSTSHVLVLPSIEEGFAKVQSEAMACGTPVIGSRNSGARDLFTDGREGFVIEPGDPDVLADRMQRLADDPSFRAELARRSQERVTRLNGWDDYGDQVRD
ncbi:MAG: glycosyltransferase family 4 protein, partial [Rhodovibrio sp.]|nr:glycosyltransferase family 4 protein [Rhodovibrio sp.]